MAISAVSSRERAKILWSTSYRVSLRLDTAQLGDGPPVVLLHGLSATKRYVVHRSKALPRSGHRIVAYDARGHGESAAPEDPGAYEYSDLCSDLGRIMDEYGT